MLPKQQVAEVWEESRLLSFSSFSSFCVKEEIEKDLGHHNSGIMQINPPSDNGLERPLSQLTEGV